MTSKYTIDAPDERWDEWTGTVTRQYSRLGDRILELLVLDYLSHQKYGYGIIEHADREGDIDYQTITQHIEQTQDTDDDTNDNNDSDTNTTG